MNKYETLFIVKPDLPENEVDACVDRISDRIKRTRGQTLKIDYWGQRRMAYPVSYRGEHISRGYYVLMTYLGEGDTVEEVARNIKIMDPTFRYLTTMIEKDPPPPEEGFEIEVTRPEQKKAAPPEPEAPEEPIEPKAQEQESAPEEAKSPEDSEALKEPEAEAGQTESPSEDEQPAEDGKSAEEPGEETPGEDQEPDQATIPEQEDKQDDEKDEE